MDLAWILGCRFLSCSGSPFYAWSTTTRSINPSINNDSGQEGGSGVKLLPTEFLSAETHSGDRSFRQHKKCWSLLHVSAKNSHVPYYLAEIPDVFQSTSIIDVKTSQDDKLTLRKGASEISRPLPKFLCYLVLSSTQPNNFCEGCGASLAGGREIIHVQKESLTAFPMK